MCVVCRRRITLFVVLSNRSCEWYVFILSYIYIYIYIGKNVFKTTRSFCYQWFRVSILQANANRPFILSSMKRTTGGGHLENAINTQIRRQKMPWKDTN